MIQENACTEIERVEGKTTVIYEQQQQQNVIHFRRRLDRLGSSDSRYTHRQ